MDPRELNQVRQIIEKSTSKVSLRDLEKKGFRKVKVLRSNDIDRMIREAVETALAQGVRDQEQLVARTRAALKQKMADAKETTRQIQDLETARLAAEGETRTLAMRVQELEAQLRAAAARTEQGEAEAARMRQVESRARELEDRAERAEARCRAMEEDASRSRMQLGERESELERRWREAEGRAQTAEKRAKDASGLESELSKLRGALAQAQTEKRLVEELEIPRLKQRIQELESSRAPAGPAIDPSMMRAMFKELLDESGVRAGGGGGADMSKQFEALQRSIASIGRGGDATMADLDDMKISLETLFSHEANADVESNIKNVQVKEKTSQGVNSNLNKLKSLRKKQ